MAKIKLAPKDKNPNRVTFAERMGYGGWLIISCVTTLLWIFFMFFMEDEWILKDLLSEANSPMMILESYRKWQTIMITFYVVSAAGSIVWWMFCYRQQCQMQKTRKWKWRADKMQSLLYKRYGGRKRHLELVPPSRGAVIGGCVVPVIAAAMLTSMLLDYGKGLQEDILAIREGNLREEVLCVYPKGEVIGLANSLTDCVVEYETSGLEIYVPLYMGFVADKHERYRPDYDRTWQEKHSATYKVTYTPNYRLVTSIELVKPAE